MSGTAPPGFHEIEKGLPPTARLKKGIILVILAIGCACLAGPVDATRAASQAPTGSPSSERKGTMLATEQTQGQKVRVPHRDVLPHTKTETATFALG
jgi:GTP cyclohydrolase III